MQRHNRREEDQIEEGGLNKHLGEERGRRLAWNTAECFSAAASYTNCEPHTHRALISATQTQGHPAAPCRQRSDLQAHRCIQLFVGVSALSVFIPAAPEQRLQ